MPHRRQLFAASDRWWWPPVKVAPPLFSRTAGCAEVYRRGLVGAGADRVRAARTRAVAGMLAGLVLCTLA
jgi:hypothetical protein